MQKLLIICGPTATGKTSFALKVAQKFNGELISADSRQVYTGMDIVTGKDLPVPNLTKHPSPEMRRGGGGEVEKNLVETENQGVSSNLQWKNRFLKYYLINGVKIWLYDIVNPDEPFNVSFWHECASFVIADINARNKLPIVVGGTGLYLKSLTHSLSQISIPQNQKLRAKFNDKSPDELFNYLNQIDPITAGKMNSSDRHNPRRLIRAIELSSYLISPPLKVRGGLGGCYDSREIVGSEDISNHETMKQFSHLSIGLTAPKEHLYTRIDKRVDERVSLGAEKEAEKLIKKYNPDLPSMTSSGYRAFLSPDPIPKWKTLEHQYARRQLTWFKKEPGIIWFDICTSGWKQQAIGNILNWYNKSNAQEG